MNAMAGDLRGRQDDRDFDAAAERDYQRRHGPPPGRDADRREAHRSAEPRTWLSKASDEVAAWFGNPGALSRRQRDKAVGDHTGQGPASQLDGDARIVDDINRRLTDDPGLNASRINVVSASGAVTLNGSVSTSDERRRAEDLAGAVAGVDRVQNKLIVA
jgi:osmotically-inducible protein OsmY